MAKELTLNQRLVLNALNDATKPDYLSNIQKQIAVTYDAKVGLARIRDALLKFSKLGYVTVAKVKLDKRKTVPVYRIAPNGRAALGL